MYRTVLLSGILSLIFGLSNAQTTTNSLRGGIVINELLADPSGYTSYDTDSNGVADDSDEFVELYNTSGTPINLGGLELWDYDKKKWFSFPDTTLAPESFAVVLVKVSAGGKLPVPATGNMAFDAAGTSTLNDSGDNIFLYDPDTDTYLHVVFNGVSTLSPASINGFSSTASRAGGIDDFGYDTDGKSLTRYPDGDQFTGVHTDHFTENSSPGGSPFQVEITGTAGWRMLSFPVTGASVSDLTDDTAIQGVSGGDDASAEASFYTYDSTGAFEVPASVTAPIDTGLGFIVYFFDNETGGSSELPLTLDISGTQPNVDVWVPLNTGTNKFTLAGNPFSKSFRLDYLYATGGFISQNVSFWDHNTGSYTVRQRDDGYHVKPWEAFWVEASDPRVHSVTIPIAARVISDFYIKEVQKETSYKEVDLSFSLTSGSTYDEALRLTISDRAGFEYDTLDATKLIPLTDTYATMAFRSGDLLKSVESVPYDLGQEIILDLETQMAGVSGSFTFAWKGLEDWDSDWDLILTDRKTGTTIDMRNNSEYVFEAEADPKAKTVMSSVLKGPGAMPMKAKNAEAPRFSVTVIPNASSVNNEQNGRPETIALNQNYPNPFNPATTINYSMEQPGQVRLTVYNLLGMKVAELVNEVKSAGVHTASWDAAEMSSGVYIYRLETGGHTLTRKMTLIK